MITIRYTVNGRSGVWTVPTRERADSFIAHVRARGGVAEIV